MSTGPRASSSHVGRYAKNATWKVALQLVGRMGPRSAYVARFVKGALPVSATFQADL